MEKFQKYCLSVLLVIICSNASAQAPTGCFENEDCRQLYELYHQILNHDGTVSQKLSVKEDQKGHLAISQKQNAADLIGNIVCIKTRTHFYQNVAGTGLSEKEKHDQLLKNFEKNSKVYVFADILYFKTKVSKIRNKDYLSLMS